MRVRVHVCQAPLRAPLRAAWGSVAVRELLVLELEDHEGVRGYGEAAPLLAYDGVSVSDVEDALADCQATLTAARQLDRAELLSECARLTVVPQALAAIDLALWDLAGKRAGRPVWRLLGASGPGPVELNYTIRAPDRAGAAREAAGARSAGFRCLKLKVAIGDDAGRLAAVRAAAGSEMSIRLDANGAWSPEQAQAALRVLAPAGLELCEEPVDGLEETAALAGAVPVAIAIDESTAEAGALEHRVCQAVCLKLGRCGGITHLLEAAARARRAGYEVYVASALDGPIGIAGALHAAAAIAPDRPCGLATLDLFERPWPGLRIDAGRAWAPGRAGLGENLRAWYG